MSLLSLVGIVDGCDHRFEFGAMYFMISTLSFMFYNMGLERRYVISVFCI